MSDFRLTTFDNPYDPFEQFTSWFLFDVEKGYNTCALLGRIEHVSDEMSEKESDIEHERAIDEIITNDFLNIYKKVSRNSVAYTVGDHKDMEKDREGVV